jgi:hypothetical protein
MPTATAAGPKWLLAAPAVGTDVGEAVAVPEPPVVVEEDSVGYGAPVADIVAFDELIGEGSTAGA